MGRLFFILVVLLQTACAPQVKVRQNITTTEPIAGLDVTVEHKPPYLWSILATNNTAGTVKLLWDDSAYVSTSGKSMRLIRGDTRIMDTGKTQPPVPIPPGATLQETFTLEPMIQVMRQHGQITVSSPGQSAYFHFAFDVGGEAKRLVAGGPFEAASPAKSD